MTREEAIDIIKCLAWHTRPDEEDVEQAIKVLEQEPCEDAISREEAIKWMENIKTLNQYYHPEDNDDETLVSEVISRLNQLPPAVPDWIPVSSKRLPEEENRLYWVCTNTGYQCQCRWTNDIYGLGESDRWGWKIFDIPQYQKVIAWMPLPAPYKAESEG